MTENLPPGYKKSTVPTQSKEDVPPQERKSTHDLIKELMEKLPPHDHQTPLDDLSEFMEKHGDRAKRLLSYWWSMNYDLEARIKTREKNRLIDRKIGETSKDKVSALLCRAEEEVKDWEEVEKEWFQQQEWFRLKDRCLVHSLGGLDEEYLRLEAKIYVYIKYRIHELPLLSKNEEAQFRRIEENLISRRLRALELINSLKVKEKEREEEEEQWRRDAEWDAEQSCVQQCLEDEEDDEEEDQRRRKEDEERKRLREEEEECLREEKKRLREEEEAELIRRRKEG